MQDTSDLTKPNGYKKKLGACKYMDFLKRLWKIDLTLFHKFRTLFKKILVLQLSSRLQKKPNPKN
ncbi:unnamed protein product [Larinioides sclopetarius]|uniref:Uncharacterized protein n=1 Tax=Larinioides sclopetarius TaxID=280406 RepID=A0AAV2A4S1_9ARAC